MRSPSEMAQGTSHGVARMEEVREESSSDVAQGTSCAAPSEGAQGMSQEAAHVLSRPREAP